MALNEETEAVFKSSRNKVDPVSGNDIPPGSLAEEVRDDIPAMLSEGEYVVPADVLRFYGLKFFEDLRNKAKKGMAKMEEDGRIGGEPIEDEELVELPFDDDELETIEMKDGGVVYANEGLDLGKYPETQVPVSSPRLDPDDPTRVLMDSPYFDSYSMGPTGTQRGYEYITYVSPSGGTMVIPFFNGAPLAMIPEGYTREDEAKKEKEESVITEKDESPIEGLASQVQERYRKENEQKVDYTNPDQVERAVEKYHSSSAFPSIASVFLPGVLGSIVGVGAREGRLQDKNEILAGINTSLENESLDAELKKQLETQKELLLDEEKFKAQKQEKGFADTFLGDLLGFDGTFGLSEKRRAKSERPDYASQLKNIGRQSSFLGSEADAYNAAVERGDDAIVNHFQAIDRLRNKQNVFADKGLSREEGAAMGLSEHDMNQAEKFGGSLQRAIDEGKVEKSGGLFSSYKKVEKDEEEN